MYSELDIFCYQPLDIFVKLIHYDKNLTKIIKIFHERLA